MIARAVLVQILDVARWAPSGDNAQPWRFEIGEDGQIVIHGHDTRDWCVYDLEGRASHMAHGALLETIRIAATAHGMTVSWGIRTPMGDREPVYDIRLAPCGGIAPDPLLPYIEKRAVQRRPMATTPLTHSERAALVGAVGEGYTLQFFETLHQRWRVARLLWANARIRLTCPEAYQVHRQVIEWGARYSTDRIPEQAVGVDPLTGKLMAWVMQSWGRVEFFNRYLLGTVAPRVQLDLLPAVACASHVLLRPVQPLTTFEDYLRLGAEMQRMWLTATAHGLHLQPEMTPVIFRWYARTGKPISSRPGIDASAAKLAAQFENLAGAGVSEPFGFFCRVGHSTPPRSRSLRKALADLLD